MRSITCRCGRQRLPVCQRTRSIHWSIPAPPGQSRGPNGIFNGPDPVTNLIFGGIPFPNQQFLAENSFGDIVWDDTIRENAFEAVDLTSHEAPEPGTVLLVGTGLLAIGSIRRRLFR